MADTKTEIVISGPCCKQCGREGYSRIAVTNKLSEYENAVKTKKGELYCEECFMEKLTGLSMGTIQKAGLSSSSGE